MDVCLALLPWKVLWGLQMRRIEKIGVALAMSLGLLCVGTSLICHCHKLADQHLVRVQPHSCGAVTFFNCRNRIYLVSYYRAVVCVCSGWFLT